MNNERRASKSDQHFEAMSRLVDEHPIGRPMSRVVKKSDTRMPLSHEDIDAIERRTQRLANRYGRYNKPKGDGRISLDHATVFRLCLMAHRLHDELAKASPAEP